MFVCVREREIHPLFLKLAVMQQKSVCQETKQKKKKTKKKKKRGLLVVWQTLYVTFAVLMSLVSYFSFGIYNKSTTLQENN